MLATNQDIAFRWSVSVSCVMCRACAAFASGVGLCLGSVSCCCSRALLPRWRPAGVPPVSRSCFFFFFFLTHISVFFRDRERGDAFFQLDADVR